QVLKPLSLVPVLAFIVVLAIPEAVLNPTRPMVGAESIFFTHRLTQYFANRPELADSYVQTVRELSDADCSQIGLVSGADDWEYPLWPLLASTQLAEFRIEHFMVSNRTAKFSVDPPFGSFE